MQTQEIGFGELRRAYVQVREFVKEKTGCEDKEIGLYSTIEEDLEIFGEDLGFFFEDFAKKFGFATEKQSKWAEWSFKVFACFFLVGLAYCIVTEFLKFLAICLAILGLMAILAVVDYFSLPKQITLVAKKDWQQDKLTVADLVSSLIAKEFVHKNEVTYVLKRKE